MARIRLHPGVWANFGSFALTGAGAVTGATAAAPLAQYIGWAGMCFGLMILVWGITIDDEHWWNFKRRRKRGNITLADSVRRMGHGSQWSLDAELVGPSGWPNDATQEILDALSRGQIEAWGRWRPTYGTPNSAVTKISPNEWGALVPEIRLIINRRMSLANRLSSTNEGAGLYHEITLDRSDVQRLWPRWSFGSRLKRWIEPSKNQSFAEQFGQLQDWRKGNENLPKRSEYYWDEPK